MGKKLVKIKTQVRSNGTGTVKISSGGKTVTKTIRVK